MEQTKALIVFCEGAHDVAFCQLVFEHFLGATENIKLKVSQFPAPFNRLFEKNMKKHFFDDMSLNMAHKFYLPNTVFIKDEWLLLLFNSGGKTNTKNPQQFLKDFLPLKNRDTIFPEGAPSAITDAKYLFLFDADEKHPKEIFAQVIQDYSGILNDIDKKEPWLSGDFIAMTENPFAATTKGKDVAIYVWADPIEQTGTLEEYLLPLFYEEQKCLTEKAMQFVDDAFLWDTHHPKNETKISAISNRKKAIITALGQGENPGSPMSAIVGRSKLISKKTLQKSEPTRNFARFLSTFTGIQLSLLK